MTTIGRSAAAVALLLVLSGGTAHAQGDPAQGERLFARCRACHSLEPGQHKIGPSLAGVVGRRAGTAEGYNYSDAMKNADVVWNEETLSQYLAAPREFIPGNKMIFPGLPNEQDRQNIIAYLKQATPQ